jgi:fused signal recognition particle receptor
MAFQFAQKIARFFGVGKRLSDELYDELCDLLVEGDFGAAEAMKAVDELRELCRREKAATPADARRLLAGVLRRILDEAPPPPEPTFTGKGLSVLLLLGVNGVGKTTTCAKLAVRFAAQKPVLAACDTFRAAAIDQLKIHGERTKCRVVAHQPGGDPAAVVFDAMEAATAAGSGLVIADTAGRMHTKNALVEELKKIDRVVLSKNPALYLKYLVLDATTGRNAVAQAETFGAAVKIDGVILTKYDSTAKGGSVFSLAGSLKMPIVYVCTGERYGDIALFSPEQFCADFVGQ